MATCLHSIMNWINTVGIFVSSYFIPAFYSSFSLSFLFIWHTLVSPSPSLSFSSDTHSSSHQLAICRVKVSSGCLRSLSRYLFPICLSCLCYCLRRQYLPHLTSKLHASYMLNKRKERLKRENVLVIYFLILFWHYFPFLLLAPLSVILFDTIF